MSSDVTCGVKRGSDELFSETNTVSNGSDMSPEHNHNDGSDAKKVKLENNKPSRVVHIRNIPNDASETDIIHLGLPFGKVSNFLVLKGKNQAFLEMADESSAEAMLSYFNSSGPPMIRGRTVYVQYSNHQELKTDSQSNAHSANQLYQTETQGGPNTVLRVIIDNQIYPVTLEVLYQIFSQVGKVLKIVTFTKNGTFQALIQYPDIITAQAAKLSLDGQNIYNGCCTLRIEYSKLNVLSVKYNNEKSRDFCNPTLPSGFGSTGSSGIGFPGNQFMNSVILVSNLNEEMVVPDYLFTLFGVYGDVKRVKILYNKKDNALIQMAEPQQAQLAITHLDKIKLFGKKIRVAPSKHRIVQMPKEGQSDNGLTKDYSFSPLHRFKKPGSKNHQNIYSPSSTLHLSNISSSITEEEIRDAFSETGEVVAFKFFPNDRKMALIQMGSVEESVSALIKMHNYKMSDSSHLRVSFSKSTI